MEFFTTFLWLCAFIGIVVTLYYIYERSSLMISRQYYCPPNLLHTQLIADGILLGKYIAILLILVEIGSLAFYLKGIINIPETFIFVANSLVLLYLIISAIYLGKGSYLMEIYESLRSKWESGKTDGEFYNDEVNVYRTIRDCNDFTIFLCCIMIQFFLLIYVIL